MNEKPMNLNLPDNCPVGTTFTITHCKQGWVITRVNDDHRLDKVCYDIENITSALQPLIERNLELEDYGAFHALAGISLIVSLMCFFKVFL